MFALKGGGTKSLLIQRTWGGWLSVAGAPSQCGQTPWSWASDAKVESKQGLIKTWLPAGLLSHPALPSTDVCSALSITAGGRAMRAVTAFLLAPPLPTFRGRPCEMGADPYPEPTDRGQPSPALQGPQTACSVGICLLSRGHWELVICQGARP